MERLTDEMLHRLKETLTKVQSGIPAGMTVDSEGIRYCSKNGDTLYTGEDLALLLASYPTLLREIERLREQNREYREALRPFARAADDPKYHTLVLSYSSRENVPTDDDFRRAKALLEKEG